MIHLSCLYWHFIRGFASWQFVILLNILLVSRTNIFLKENPSTGKKLEIYNCKERVCGKETSISMMTSFPWDPRQVWGDHLNCQIVCLPIGPAQSAFSDIYRVAPPKMEQSIFLGLCSDQQLSFFTLLDKTSFPHYDNTKIIKIGWKLFILWVISYGLSFSGFAINFSSWWVAPKKRNSQFFRTLLWWTVIFFTLLDRASFPHYNDTKIIKFGWRTFYFMSNFLSTVIFGICHSFVIVPRNSGGSSIFSRKWQSIRNVS